MTFIKLSFADDIFIQIDLDSQPMLVPIDELSVVNFIIVKIQKTFIQGLLFNRVTKIDTVFVFFNGRVPDDNVT